jgi:hypothetical protein
MQRIHPLHQAEKDTTASCLLSGEGAPGGVRAIAAIKDNISKAPLDNTSLPYPQVSLEHTDRWCFREQ